MNDPNVKIIKNATRDDVQPGDHLTWERTDERGGVIITERREGIAEFLDDDGDWHAEGSGWITDGEGEGITLTIRRPVQELPTKFRTVIVPADGREYIEAEVDGTVWRTREAILGLDGRWHGVWRAGRVAVGSTSSDSITLDTWKEDDR